jgi:DNA primase
MQKNLPKSTPDWVRTTTLWAEASHRDVTYALCDDRRTLLWFANQRAVEYHPALVPVDRDAATHLVLDLDPPEAVPFADVVRVAELVRQALTRRPRRRPEDERLEGRAHVRAARRADER